MFIQKIQKILDLGRMVLRPVRLGKHVIDDIKPVSFQKAERLLDEAVLSRPGIGEDEVEAGSVRGQVRNEPVTVVTMEPLERFELPALGTGILASD